WLNRHLAQQTDNWQVDIRQTPILVGQGHDRFRPWVMLVIREATGHVLAHEITEATPTPAHLWDLLVKAMQHPAIGEPSRPTEVQVRSDERWESLRRHAEEIGVQLRPLENLTELNDAFASLVEHVAGGPGRLGLLAVAGVQVEQVGRFYDAAAY